MSSSHDSTRDILDALQDVLQARRSADPGESYVARLHAGGLNRILKKVGEEATEVILAARDAEHGGPPAAVVAEVADLWFHNLVMLSHLGIGHREVLDELARRFGVSGLEEKASRAR